MRVIDANELYRVKFHGYPDIEITPSDVNAEAYKRGWNDAIDAVVECAPTTDAVDVVRCKDCVYYEWLNNNEHYCDAIYRNLSGDDEGVDFEPPQDHFCAYGVRRKADG